MFFRTSPSRGPPYCGCTVWCVWVVKPVGDPERVKSGAAGIHHVGLESCTASPVDDTSDQIAGDRFSVNSALTGLCCSLSWRTTTIIKHIVFTLQHCVLSISLLWVLLCEEEMFCSGVRGPKHELYQSSKNNPGRNPSEKLPQTGLLCNISDVDFHSA